jgi:hypothetical protein
MDGESANSALGGQRMWMSAVGAIIADGEVEAIGGRLASAWRMGQYEEPWE